MDSRIRYTILIVEDEEYNRDLYAEILSSKDCKVVIASDPQEGLRQYERAKPDLILLDLKFDTGSSRDGLEFLSAVRKKDRSTEVVVISGSQRDATKIEAMLKSGAYDFLEKPVRRDVLSVIVDRALERADLKRENERLKERLNESDRFMGIIGKSEEMLKVFDRIQKAARVDSTILIKGETGTGKELVARAIHTLSGRSPFVVADVSKTSPDLASSELFGHEKGAYTGATQRRIAKLESAGSGTLFLDEVENIPIEVQIKLLRVLQDRTFERLGGNSQLQLEARIIVATNRDLSELVKSGQFRDDLYHRLRVAIIELPLLRERRSDIPLLAEYFLDLYSKNLEIYKQLSDESLHKISRYDWPGNVRELKNAIENSLLFGGSDRYIEPEDLELEMYRELEESSLSPDENQIGGLTLREAVNRAKFEILDNALSQSKGTIGRAALILEITPRHLKRLMDEFGIDSEEYKD